MANSQVVKQAETRAWTDLEPKLVTFLTTGAVLTAAAYVASLFGFHLEDWQSAGITWLASSIAGYLKKSNTLVPSPVPVTEAPTTITPAAGD